MSRKAGPALLGFNITLRGEGGMVPDKYLTRVKRLPPWFHQVQGGSGYTWCGRCLLSCGSVGVFSSITPVFLVSINI